MADIQIPVAKTLLPGDMSAAKALLGFDHGDYLYHVLLFLDGEGSIGILRDGDNFCARLSLDSLVEFYLQAKAGHIQGNG